MADETVFNRSNLGKRLEKFNKKDTRFLIFNNQQIPVISQITIGRHKTNNIVLDDKLVSRNHALIQKIKKDFYIKDLDSSNGTFVNEKQIPKDKYIKIKNGDVVRCGKSKLAMN